MTNRKRKDDIKYHELLKQAAMYAYKKNNKILPEGYNNVTSTSNLLNGFYADTLSNGEDFILAIRGSQDISDYVNDIQMARSKVPNQLVDALKAYDNIRELNPDAKVALTGHSLGGSLAQMVAALRGAEAVTFNAYGTGDIVKDRENLKADNIVNYINKMDTVPMANVQHQLGEIYVVPQLRNTNGKIRRHFLESMGNLYERQLSTPEELYIQTQSIHPNLVTAQNKVHKFSEDINGIKDNIKNVSTNIKNSILTMPIGQTVQQGLNGVKHNPSQFGLYPKFNEQLYQQTQQPTYCKNIYSNQKNTWGSFTTKDIFKKRYKGKRLDEMSSWEVDQMLDDLL